MLKTSLIALFALLLAPALFADGAERREPGETSTATFAMYCYWTGEATVGRVPGVLRSRIGHWGGREVVQVDYDPQQTSVEQLATALRRQRSFDAVVVADDDEARHLAGRFDDSEILEAGGKPRFIEPKHSLRSRHPELLDLGLSETQAIALNSWSYFGGPMPDVLTPRQRARLEGSR